MITNEIFESYREDQKKIKEAKDFLRTKGFVFGTLYKTPVGMLVSERQAL